MIKPKRDRKKKIIPGKYEVYGKRGNYVFTAYDYWFEWFEPKAEFLRSEKASEKFKGRDITRTRALINLPWDELFEV